MRIDRRTVDGIIVLHLHGKITLGEGDLLLDENIRSLLESGCRELVLDFEEVPYIDSSGLHQMAATFMRFGSKGGRVVYCNLNKRLEDLFSITKLMTILDVVDGVERAVALLRHEPIVSSCPVCGPRVRVPVRQLSATTHHVCPRCEVAFRVEGPLPPALSDESSASAETECPVVELQFATYDNEYVRVTPGRPFLVSVDGRLDLFAFERVERAWKSIPPPRRAVFRIGEATDVGIAKLLDLCGPAEDGSHAVVLTSDSPQPASAPGPARDPRIHHDLQAAVDALGDLESTATRLHVTVRRIG